MYSTPPRKEFWSSYASIHAAQTVSVPTVFWLLPWGNAKCSHLCAFSQTHEDRLASRCPTGHLQMFICHRGGLHRELALGRGMWMRWGAQGWAGPQARCLQWFGAPCWGLHMVSRTHVPWRILALDAVLLASPHPSHAGDPSVLDKGREKRAGRWGHGTCSHALIFPTGKILCWEGCLGTKQCHVKGKMRLLL